MLIIKLKRIVSFYYCPERFGPDSIFNDGTVVWETGFGRYHLYSDGQSRTDDFILGQEAAEKAGFKKRVNYGEEKKSSKRLECSERSF